MNLRYTWLDDDYEGQPAWERATMATLCIELGQKVATRHIRRDQKSEEVVVPLYELAEWFCRNWFSLLYEPSRLTEAPPESHRMRGAIHGYALPDVAIWGGNSPLVYVKRHEHRYAQVEFLDEAYEWVTLRSLEQTATDLICSVLDRLASANISGTSLQAEWPLVSGLNPNEYHYAVACARFGLDPFGKEDYTSTLEPLFAAGESFAEDVSEVYGANELSLARAVVTEVMASTSEPSRRQPLRRYTRFARERGLAPYDVGWRAARSLVKGLEEEWKSWSVR